MSDTFNAKKWRSRLERLDDTEIDTLCIDEFPEVYDKFGRGMMRIEKINEILVKCRRDPTVL